MQTQNQRTIKSSFLNLMAAIIVRSLEDLRGVSAMSRKTSRQDIDGAMSFFNGSDYEAYCLELGIDYEKLREEARELYRRFLERAEGHEKAPRKPRKRPGQNHHHWPVNIKAAQPDGSGGRFGEGPQAAPDEPSWR
jgi:hypothetical protein